GMLLVRLLKKRVFNPKPNNLDRRFRIYRETLSRFSCAASNNLDRRFRIYRETLSRFSCAASVMNDASLIWYLLMIDLIFGLSFSKPK
ncbi:hypothetical protein ACTMNS_07375, partial [Staphylococcus haemolyticus]